MNIMSNVDVKNNINNLIILESSKSLTTTFGLDIGDMQGYHKSFAEPQAPPYLWPASQTFENIRKIFSSENPKK